VGKIKKTGDLMKEYKPSVDIVKVEEWALLILIAFIPMINLIFLSIVAFKSSSNKSKSNFAKAALIYVVICYLLIVMSSWWL